MALFSARRRWGGQRDELTTLGPDPEPRWVDVTGEVSMHERVRSPLSGASCAYYHAEIGVIDYLEAPGQRVSMFHSLASVASPHDLIVRTADASVRLAAGFFVVVARSLPSKARSLAAIPSELEHLEIKSDRPLWYREVTLSERARVRFAGIIETVLESSGYRTIAQRAHRMRPTREQLVINEIV